MTAEEARAALDKAARLWRDGSDAEAAEICAAVIEERPREFDAWHLLGIISLLRGDCTRAVELIRSALSIDPTIAEAHKNLGAAFSGLGRYREAKESCELALAIDPDYADAHWNRGLAALALGDFETGWQEYEWRWQAAGTGLVRRALAWPLWLGREDIRDKTILLHAEQGIGDTFQFARYVPLVAERGARVVLEVQPGLKAVLEGLAGAWLVVERGETLPDFDCHCPLLSLPRAFATRLATIPADIPYIRPRPWAVAKWEMYFGKRDRIRAGLVWSGNIDNSRLRDRAIALERLAPLLRVPNVLWVSLQVDERRSDIGRAAPGVITDLAWALVDWAETAAAIACLDLVVSVDTAVAHLAGAMGKPVWLLSRFNADWRWLCDRSDSPWYPTMRIFRQAKSGDWTGPIAAAQSEIARRARHFRETRKGD